MSCSKFFCDACSKLYETENNLNRHLLSKHKIDRTANEAATAARVGAAAAAANRDDAKNAKSSATMLSASVCTHRSGAGSSSTSSTRTAVAVRTLASICCATTAAPADAADATATADDVVTASVAVEKETATPLPSAAASFVELSVKLPRRPQLLSLSSVNDTKPTPADENLRAWQSFEAALVAALHRFDELCRTEDAAREQLRARLATEIEHCYEMVGRLVHDARIGPLAKRLKSTSAQM